MSFKLSRKHIEVRFSETNFPLEKGFFVLFFLSQTPSNQHHHFNCEVFQEILVNHCERFEGMSGLNFLFSGMSIEVLAQCKLDNGSHFF